VFQGYEIHTYVCSLPDFSIDSSADLIMDLFYADREITPDNPNAECSTILPDDSAASADSQIFDSLARTNLPNGFSNCALAHIRPAIPGRAYCHRVCMKDLAGNQVCREPDSFNNPDGVPSDFAGIKSLEAMADGHSLLAKWDLPQTDNPLQFDTILYRASIGLVESDGSIEWSSNQLTVDDVNTTELEISGLETGREYAVKVEAIDAAGYRVGGEAALRKKTLNNNPEVTNVRMELVGLGQVRLSFRTTNRLGLNSQLSGLAMQLDSSTSALSQISGLDNYMITPYSASSSNASGEVSVVLSLEDFLRVELFDDLSYAIQVTALGNGQNYQGDFSGAAQLLPGVSIQTNSFSSTALAGGACSLSPQQPVQPITLVLIGGLLLGLWAMRRRQISTSKVA
jgi:hypothetical protein